MPQVRGLGQSYDFLLALGRILILLSVGPCMQLDGLRSRINGRPYDFLIGVDKKAYFDPQRLKLMNGVRDR